MRRTPDTSRPTPECARNRAPALRGRHAVALYANVAAPLKDGQNIHETSPGHPCALYDLDSAHRARIARQQAKNALCAERERHSTAAHEGHRHVAQWLPIPATTSTTHPESSTATATAAVRFLMFSTRTISAKRSRSCWKSSTSLDSGHLCHHDRRVLTTIRSPAPSFGR